MRDTNAVLSGIVLVLFVLLLFVLRAAKKARAVEQGRDVGVAVFVEEPTEDDYDYGCPMVIDEEFLPPIEDDPVAIRLGIVPVPSEYLDAMWRRS